MKSYAIFHRESIYFAIKKKKNYTLKGNATVKHVLTDGVKNHILPLWPPNDIWPNDYYVRYVGLDWWLLWQDSVKFGQSTTLSKQNGD